MNWEFGVAIAEIVGAIGVIVTLAYLARQIVQTNRIARSAAVGGLQQKYNDFYMLILANREVAGLAAKLTNPDFVAASGAETMDVESFANVLASIWFSTQVSYDQGQINEREYRVYKEDVSARIKQWPAAEPYFKSVIERYPSAIEFE